MAFIIFCHFDCQLISNKNAEKKCLFGVSVWNGLVRLAYSIFSP